MASDARYINGDLDEVVGQDVKCFHLEQLDTGVWWIGLDYADGTTDHITLSTARGAKVSALFQQDV